jgi:ABC-2 type transport system permease protein
LGQSRNKVTLLFTGSPSRPWAGSLMAITASAVGVNLYSADDSASWLSLMTPGLLRADVRGRQLAWRLIVTPVSRTV